ncbi:LegK7 family Dot/Icm T4SS effector kinase [Legionella sp. WA2022007384]
MKININSIFLIFDVGVPMGLKIEPISAKHRKLRRLIQEFNKISDEDVVQRLYYLQKINYAINSTPISEGEFKWLSARDKDSWQAHLEAYGINPDGSFLLKGFQFANAVAKQIAASKFRASEGEDIYQLMQKRDALLKSTEPFEQVKNEFLAISYRLNLLAEKNAILKKELDEHKQILHLAKEKISAIKGEIDLSSSEYMTEPLGEKQVNNHNYKFKMKRWEKYLVFRVEDRNDLSFEQDLHSFPVAKYFVNDAALFMMQFESEHSKEIEYKPVVISQFAEQGSLVNVAKTLKGESQQKIAATAQFYFKQINNFLLELEKANAYHPDIKLSNFLVHQNKLLVSDRKTFVRSAQPLASDLRSTPRYAPPQYLACLDDKCEDYRPKARTTHIDIKQLMSYQLGKMLKEFLIVTQLGELPTKSGKEHRNVLAHFHKPNRAITNFSILIDELTRFDEGKRLTIEQFNRLLPFLNHKTDFFYQQIELQLSSETLDIDGELKEVKKLLNSNKFKGINYLARANVIFSAISERTPSEPRLNYIAEKLATKCYQKYSKNYFSGISQEIEAALLTNDWNSASWWRQMVQTLSWGFFRVPRVTTADQIKISLDYNDQNFQTHFHQFEFLPAEELDSLGITEADNFKEYFKVHFDEIRALNNKEANRAEEELAAQASGVSKDSGTISSSRKKQKEDESSEEFLPSDTMVVKNVTEEKNTKTSEEGSSPLKSSADAPPSTEPQKTTSQTEEKPGHQRKTSVTLAENYRFFAALANGYKDIDNPGVRRRSIRKVGPTLFRGEIISRVDEIFQPPSHSKPTESEAPGIGF